LLEGYKRGHLGKQNMAQRVAELRSPGVLQPTQANIAMLGGPSLVGNFRAGWFRPGFPTGYQEPIAN
jgi:hypothetical protein